MVSSRRKYHIEDTFTLSGAKTLLIPGGVGIRSKPLRFENGGSLENSYYFNLFSQFLITKPVGSSNKKLLKNEQAALVTLKKFYKEVIILFYHLKWSVLCSKNMDLNI